MARKYASTTPGSSIDDPRVFLWNDPSDKNVLPQNTANYNLLIGSFSKSDFVSFTGAGVSKSLGIDDWDNLIDKLLEVAKPEGFTEDKPATKNDYPEYIERLFRHLERKSSQGLYFDTIKGRMVPRINSTSLTLIYLSLCVDIHLTTNFDRSIEHAYSCVDYLRGFFKAKGNNPQPKRYYIGNLNDNPSGPTIIYLHGSESENIYILKKSDYDCFYPSVSGRSTDISEEVEHCLKHYYLSKHILFIGFSFEDPYVRDYFFGLAKKIERDEESTQKLYSEAGRSKAFNKKQHFLLIDKNNAFVSSYKNNTFSELQKYNLYPIIFDTGEHIFLEHIFKIFVNKTNGM